jgi:hypothetical protein
MSEPRLVPVTLLKDEWVTVIDALSDRAEQCEDLANTADLGEHRDDVVKAGLEYGEMAQAIEDQIVEAD